MNALTLILRSLRFYWRTHLGVLLGSAVGCAVLVGALAAGDSVRGTLRAMATSRLGGVTAALVGGDRFFGADLAGKVGDDLGAPASSVLQVRGLATAAGGSVRAGGVQVLGVDEQFWKLGGAADLLAGAEEDQVVLNQALAERLGAREGDKIVIRVDKPGPLPPDAPLSHDSDLSVGIPLRVKAIAREADFGRFSLQANQVSPMTAMLPREVLAAKLRLPGSGRVEGIGAEAVALCIGSSRPMAVMLAREVLAAKLRLPGRANLILLGEPAGKAGQSDDANAANASLRRVWRLSDAELELRELDKLGVLELRTRRVLLDAAAVRAAAAADREATGLQTYFAKELRVGDRSTPYSIVTAIGPLNPRQRATASASMPSTRPIDPVPPDMQDGQVLINSWLERDLDAQPGQKLQMTYLVVGPMLKLQERTATFTIRDASVPVEAGDREMLPEIPGVPADDDPRKWKIGIKIEEGKWREDIDGKYWREHRGTPKAFLTLRAGRAIWASRFGDLTAVRWRLAPGLKGRVEAALRANLDPAAVGLFFLPVRKQALAAADQALDFGQLFLGLSFFLIVAALLLTVLLFVLGVEQRRQEVGLLLAVGLRPGQVRRMLLLEGAALAVMGGIIGAAGGLLYTRALLHGLSTVWSGAVAGSAIRFHADPLTVAIGAAGGVAASLVAIWLAVRRQTRRPARELLAGGPVESVRTGASAPRGRMPWWRARSALILAVCATVAAAIAGILGLVGITSPVAAFFVAGALMLAAGIAASRWGLKALARASGARRLTLAGLAVRNSSRRPGRSLAVISLLACGSFLIIAVAAFRQDASHEPRVRSSGTGGFALYGESSLPILRDLNDPNDRKRYRFGEGAMAGVSVVAMRVHEGDDASCLNLNRAQSPRLLGVRPEDLKGRFTFVKTDAEGAEPDPWSLLSRKRDDGAIPAIGDEPTVVWGLGKKLGDTLFYVDEKAAGFKVRIVGITAGSILQGSLLISREDFEAKFPSRSGYRAFLVDAPADRADGVSQAMSQALEDFGLELSPAAKRLGEFSTVQNTYLSIFQLLGGLGMLLGSAGLALVVARNVLERRGELAILRAVGFRRAAVRLMVFAEHGLLLLAGLACGLIAAAVAIGPMLGSPGVKVPVGWLSLMLGAVLVSGALWTGVATAWAVRGPLLAALRNE